MLKAINQILLYSKDIAASKDFYTKLGFTVSDEAQDHVHFKLGEFTLQCFDESKSSFPSKAPMENKGLGMFIFVEVDDVDATYADLVAKALKPSSEPKDWPWGNREFAIKDPDGYRLVFYKPTQN